jgi:hypothetical protein
MDLEREYTNRKTAKNIDFAEPLNRKPLELLRDTEALLRTKTVETLVPVLPQPLGTRLQGASIVAEGSLNQLAEIDLEKISDWEMQPARILIGLSFIGFGALAIALLVLYVYTLHPELSQVEQIRQYWYQYTLFVGLGVAGMFMLGREAMRPKPLTRLSMNKSRLK